MKSFIKTYIQLCISIAVLSCNGQTEVPHSPDLEFSNKLNSYIKRVTDSLNINFGIGLSVVKQDQMVYEGYSGYANYERQIPVTAETNFYIASSTKSFTALAMLLLEDKDLLDIDRSLASFFPEGAFSEDLHADKVNIRDLLYHTSGLENNNITFKKAYSGDYDLEGLTHNLLNYTRVNPKANYGEFKYSNLGYNIIEIILERELEKDWKTVVNEQVLLPLGMNKTSGNISDLKKNNWPGVEPYENVNLTGDLQLLPLKKQDRIMHAAGGLISTPRDMAKFLIAQLNNGSLNGSQVFPKGMISFSQEAHAKQERNFFGLERFGYGYGWNIAKTPLGDTLIHHYGGFPGTHAEVSFMPEHGVGVSIFANSGITGLLASFLIASYSFDYYAGREDLDNYYNNKLVEYKEMLNTGFSKNQSNKIKREERTWKLDLPKRDYIGSYFSASLGTVEILLKNDQLFANVGILKSTAAEPFVNKNSVRFELIPNSGSVIQFNLEHGNVVSFTMDGLKFTKLSSKQQP